MDLANPQMIPDLNQKMTLAMTQILGAEPPMRISSEGEFKGLLDVEQFTARVRKQLDELPATLLAEGDQRLPQMRARLATAGAALLSGNYLTQKTSEGFALSTGMWIGATLAQNRWLQLDLTLSMPGTPQGFLWHEVMFQLAGWVPCDAADTESRCVELLLHATPKDSAVAVVHAELLKQGKGELTYWATTWIRVVVEPDTLRSHALEIRRHSYLALAKGAEREVEIARRIASATRSYTP